MKGSERKGTTGPLECQRSARRPGEVVRVRARSTQGLRLHGEQGLRDRTPVRRRSRDARDERIARLEREKARLEKELAVSKKLPALQK